MLLIATVPVHCFSITFITKINGYGKPNEQLFPKRWSISYLGRTEFYQEEDISQTVTLLISHSLLFLCAYNLLDNDLTAHSDRRCPPKSRTSFEFLRFYVRFISYLCPFSPVPSLNTYLSFTIMCRVSYLN